MREPGPAGRPRDGVGNPDIVSRIIPQDESRVARSSRSLHSVVRFIVFDLDGTLVDSRASRNRRTPGCAPREAGSHRPHGRRRRGHLVARAFAAAGVRPARCPGALPCHLQRAQPSAIHAAVRASRRGARGARAAAAAGRARPTSPLASTRYILQGLRFSALVLFELDLVAGGDGPWPRKPDPSGLNASLHSRRRRSRPAP